MDLIGETKIICDFDNKFLKSERETVAAETEEIGVAVSGSFSSGEQLMQRVSASMFMAFGAMLVGLRHRHAGSRGLLGVQRRTITAEYFHRRPIGKHGNRRRRM